MMEAGRLTATKPKYERIGWFENDRMQIQPLVEKKAGLLHLIRNPPKNSDIEEIKLAYKLATKEVKDRTEIAKSVWANKLGNLVNDVNITPKEAWRAAYEIRDGVKGHHKNPVVMKFRKKDGSLAANPAENAKVVEEHHFTTVFNSKRPTLPNAVKLIQQCEISQELSDPPTWEEFKTAVVKLKNDKQPGLNGVVPNAYKCLSDENLSVLFEYILKFWNGDVDFSEWHEGLGALVPKKGDQHDLNKWRLINLMLTKRAYTLLNLHCVETQRELHPENPPSPTSPTQSPIFRRLRGPCQSI
jgi:hypothetical protein